MNIKFAIILIALALIFTGTASATVVTVDDSGGQDYLTIQEAVNAADWGDDVLVYPGIYFEDSINLYKVYSMKSYSGTPTDTIIKCNLSSGSFIVDGSLLADFITVSGFSIVNFTIDPNMAFFEDNLFECSEIKGGFDDSSAVTIIKNNTFEKKGIALYRAAPSATEITGNRFYNCSIALYAKDCSQMLVEDNEFSNNNVAIGINYVGIRLVGNMIYDNGVGISGGNSAHNYIYNNYFNNTVNAVGLDVLPEHTLSVPITNGPNIVGGPKIGGNYWAKPDGSGFSQTHPDLNGDGFCDEPYVVTECGIDYYPLTKVQQATAINSEIPEFPTIALPMLAIIGLAFLFKRR